VESRLYAEHYFAALRIFLREIRRVVDAQLPTAS